MGILSFRCLVAIFLVVLKSPAISYPAELPLDLSPVDGNLQALKAPSGSDALSHENGLAASSGGTSNAGAGPLDTDDDDGALLGAAAEQEALPHHPHKAKGTGQSAVALARAKLSPEEFEDAQREVLEALGSFEKTTTTTRPPGFFKEVAIGLKNFFTAPFRATKEVFTEPSRAFSTNMGSASLTAKKLQSVAAGEKGWGEMLRDWWRLVTMSPERQRQAEELNRQSALEGGGAARNVMKDDGEAAKKFGDKLHETWQAEQFQRKVSEANKSEEQLAKEFDQMIEKGK